MMLMMMSSLVLKLWSGYLRMICQVASGKMYQLAWDMDWRLQSSLYGMTVNVNEAETGYLVSVNEVQLGYWAWKIPSKILEFHWDHLNHE
jgi:hypothetical protein